MACLSKKQIVEARDLKMEKVPVPEWAPEGEEHPEECYVMIRTMTASERDKFESGNVVLNTEEPDKSTMDLSDYRSKLCLKCMCDDDGNALFDATELGVLAGKSSLAMSRVFEVAQRLNGLQPKSMKAAIKNS